MQLLPKSPLITVISSRPKGIIDKINGIVWTSLLPTHLEHEFLGSSSVERLHSALLHFRVVGVVILALRGNNCYIQLIISFCFYF